MGITDLDPEGDVAAQVALATSAIDDVVGEAFEAVVIQQLEDRGNIKVDTVGIPKSTREAWGDLNTRLQIVENGKAKTAKAKK